MRIIAGTAKGRKLRSPRGTRTRPTSDRVRESIFAIVGEAVEGARVLDLYAGTGAMGLEALSRGAAGAAFVEQDEAALRCLVENVRLCGFTDAARIVKAPVASFIRSDQFGSAYDLVFADPPYAGDEGTLTLLALSKRAKSLHRSLVVLEHAPDRVPLSPPGNLEVVDTRRYGNVTVTFLEFADARRSY